MCCVGRGCGMPSAKCSALLPTCDYIHGIPPADTIGRWAIYILLEPGADLLQCLSRAHVVFTSNEDDAIDETQSVIDHQTFQFRVVDTTPEFAFEKRPANFDFAGCGIEIPVARASDDAC